MLVITGRAIILPQAFVGVGISTILVACTKVQRAIVVLLTLASAFKVYVKFFFMLRARLSDEISCMGIGLVQV